MDDENEDGSRDGSRDGLSFRRHTFRMGRSISMATVQAQVTLAQSLRSLFQAARDPNKTVPDTPDSPVEDIWLQAVYNAVVFSMVGVFLCILLAVYLILEPFLHPILWAVLTGAFLFPFKHAGTTRIEAWLMYIDINHIPLVASVFVSPIYSLHHIIVKIEQVILCYWKLISFLLVFALSSYISLQFDVIGLLCYFIGAVFQSFYKVDLMLTYTKHLQVVIIIIGLPMLFWYVNYSQQHQPPLILQSLVVILWYLILVNMATLSFGAIGVPLVTILFVIAALGYLIQSRKSIAESNEIKVLSKSYTRRRSVFGDAYDMIHESIVKPGIDLLDQDSTIEDIQGVEEEEEEEVESVMVDIQSEEPLTRKSTVRFKSQSYEPAYTSNFSLPTRSATFCDTSSSSVDEDISIEGTDKAEHTNASNQVFLILITLCTLLIMIRHTWLLLVLIPLGIGWCIKQLTHLLVINYCYQVVACYVSKFKIWCSTHQTKLFPQPIPTLLNLCLDFDNLALFLLKRTAGSFVSALIIISLLIGAIGLSMFLVFQIHLELSHTVGLVTQVLNTTLDDNQWVHNFLGHTDTVHTHLEQFADQGFHYGREWLADQIQGIVADSTSRENILKLYDKMYHAYVFKNSTDEQSVFEPRDDVLDDLHIWNQLKYFLSENFETIISILKSLWSILSANVSIGMTLVTSLVSIIFSGGTLLLNFVVFITTLFYLLCYSENVYLPVKLILSTLPNFVSDSHSHNYANVFTRVIQSVFYASLRRACFYGLYTWLVLSILGLEIIILPSVLAALAGAVPFVGPYWVGVPAILKLWLIKESFFQAMVALGLFLLPPFIVDSLINSEIEGSHPYLTGLAIAGGVYFAGLEGAIFGPILLCFLLFVVNLLTEHL